MASLRAGMSPLPQARWGVVDGSEVNWIGSLLPGSGVELNDGTSVTLMAVTKEEPGGAPCVAVDIVRGGKTERRKVQVDEADPLIRFEDPAHHSRIFAVYGWAQSRAEVLYLESGAPVATGSIDAGFDWRPAPDGPAIRLDNVLDAAAYAAPGDSALYEAIVRIPGRTIAVCERNAYFLGEARLDFLVDVVPAEFDYALNVTRDGQRQALVLRSGQTTSLDGWKMFIPHSRYATDSAVSFWVTDERSRRALHIGGLMSVLGGAGLFIGAVRRLGRGKRSLPSGRE